MGPLVALQEGRRGGGPSYEAMIPVQEAIVNEAVTAVENQPPRSCIDFQLITTTQVLLASSVWEWTGQEQAPSRRPPPLSCPVPLGFHTSP